MTAEVSRLLIVEDDPEMCYLLESVLGGDGREVATAARGSEAAERLAAVAYDMVILDLILPDTDGRTLLASMRAKPETAVTPVVVVTARSGEDIRQDCYALGAAAFWEKPFDVDRFAADSTEILEREALRERASLMDPLTGLLNRAGLQEAWDEAEHRLTLALVHLDGLQTVLQRRGWGTGERVVCEVAEAVRDNVEEEAGASHLGGGELVLFQPGERVAELAKVGEGVLGALTHLELSDVEGERVELLPTVAIVHPEGDTSLEEALEVARRRIFRTPDRERGRVLTEDVVGGEAPRRVLVAEDDEISATLLLHRLQKEGLEVVHFDDGRRAYDAALRDVPDLVILDVKMPGMDGFELLERLRGTTAYVGVPVIMLTSMGREADVVRGFQLGADDYVLKPFSPVELAARVRRLLARGRSASAV